MKRKSLIGLLVLALVFGMLVFAACEEDGNGDCAHIWGDWEDSAAANCTEPAKQTRTCTEDETHIETRDKPGSTAFGHDFSGNAEECRREGCNTPNPNYDPAIHSHAWVHDLCVCGEWNFTPAVIIDLAVGTGDINNTTHPTLEGQTVLIRGISNGERSITITNATQVYIANNTTILGSGSLNHSYYHDDYGYNVEVYASICVVQDNAAIYGGGPNITINGGNNEYVSGIYADSDLAIYGTIGNISGGGGHGIGTYGSLTISGTIGDITGGNDYVGLGGGSGGAGMLAMGGITISGTTGDIAGGHGGYRGGDGIATYGSLTISGTTGDISGGHGGDYGGHGIWSDSSVTISGSVGINIASSIIGGTGDIPGNQIVIARITEILEEFPNSVYNDFPRTGQPKPWVWVWQ